MFVQFEFSPFWLFEGAFKAKVIGLEQGVLCTVAISHFNIPQFESAERPHIVTDEVNAEIGHAGFWEPFRPGKVIAEFQGL
jgi:hypothetical protein